MCKEDGFMKFKQNRSKVRYRLVLLSLLKGQRQELSVFKVENASHDPCPPSHFTLSQTEPIHSPHITTEELPSLLQHNVTMARGT